MQVMKRLDRFEPHSLRLRRVRRFWRLACGHDKLGSRKQFANFSLKNPYVFKLHEALAEVRGRPVDEGMGVGV